MGNRIREVREARGWTLEDLAHEAGLSASYLSRMENSKRNVSLKNLAKCAAALGVAQADLVTEDSAKVLILGMVNAGADSVLFSDGQGPFDDVDAPSWAGPTTVAVEVRGDSLGAVFNGWLIFYDDRRDPPTDDLMGRLCVLELVDGRVMAKVIRPGSRPGAFNLFSNFSQPLYDVEIRWAAQVREMRPK